MCGASVGAITASLVAVGYTSEDLKEFMETDLRKVLVGKIRSQLADILIVYYIKERRYYVTTQKMKFSSKEIFIFCAVCAPMIPMF